MPTVITEASGQKRLKLRVRMPDARYMCEVGKTRLSNMIKARQPYLSDYDTGPIARHISSDLLYQWK